MRLAFVEVAGFRAFKDKARFDFPSGFVVLTGRNGAGKSTVMDAVDFALTGTLSKYSVLQAKGGGLADHIWWIGQGVPDDQFVRVGFVDETGSQFTVTRSREDGADVTSEEIATRLCVGQVPGGGLLRAMMGTSLIRDELITQMSMDLPEQARFSAVREAIGGLTGPDHSKRIAAVVRATEQAKDQQRKRASEVEGELGRSLAALTEAKSSAERQPDIAEAQRLLSELEPDLAIKGAETLNALRARLVQRVQDHGRLSGAVTLLESIQEERSYFASPEGQSGLAESRSELTSALQRVERANNELATAQGLEATERQNDEWTAAMVSLLQHGEAIGLRDGHCPLCRASRTTGDFEAAIAASRELLSERGARLAAIIDQVHKARDEQTHALQRFAAADSRSSKLSLRQKALGETLASVSEAFTQAGIPVPNDSEGARRALLKNQERLATLERVLYIFDVSGSQDRVTALQGRVEHLRRQLEEESTKLTASQRAFDYAHQIQNAALSAANQVLTEQFDTVLPLLKEMYRRLRPHADWREIETDFGGNVRASLNFSVGEGWNPQFVFSSGQRRAAGIAFLLAIHLSRPWCRLRSLLLDDPVQHIDDYRALNLVEVLSTIRRTGRQIIIAVEDPALADLLCRRLRSHHVESGRRFDLGTAKNGSAAILRQREIFPMSRAALLSEAS